MAPRHVLASRVGYPVRVEANLIGGLTLAEVMNSAADARERHFGVALPGIVLSYDSATQTASIQPAVNRWVPDESSPDEDLSEPLPALQSVPVMWPKGRNFSVTGTLAAGDPVLLVCIDRDMSGWRTSGAQSDPQDARLHDWSSAVAIPGLVPSTSPFPVPSDAAALASLVLARLNALVSSVNTLVANYNSHTHAVAALGTSSTTSVPGTTAASPASVASTILKLGG